jgi:CubicO group peptidase (beta-lactamase class C family)
MKAVTKIRVLTIVLLLSLATVSYSQESHVLEAVVLIEEFMADTKAPGVAVSVGLNGRIVWSEGFGYVDVEQRVPAWPGITLFRVGSVAKPMTAVAVGQLYEQGRLDLDAPIQDYVPSFTEKERPITTRQLAGHLAGIRHYQGDEFLS